MTIRIHQAVSRWLRAADPSRTGRPVRDASAEASDTRIHSDPEGAPHRGWLWLRHWELWLAMAVGAFLRLWHLGNAQFTYVDDMAGNLTLARESVLHGLLPVTGIHYTIGLMTAPLEVYTLLPFAAFGTNPFPAVVAIALWNILGLALCYALAWRYFGRRVAAIATLLFATCGTAVDFSRFLWQVNYLPPLLALWGLTLFAGCVGGARRWLAPNLILLALAGLFHPTMLTLAPVTLLAIALAPRRPRVWEFGLAAGVIALLLVPTALWEIASGGWDFVHLHTYLGQQTFFNLHVFNSIRQVIGPPTYRGVGAGSPYALVTPTSPYARLWSLQQGIQVVALLLYALSYLLLTVRVALSVVRSWHATSATLSLGRRLSATAAAYWRGVRAAPAWRAYLLLWLWVSVPPLFFLRHSSALFVHYVLSLYPAIFIVGGFGGAYLLDAVPTALDRLLRARLPRASVPARALSLALAVAVLALVIAGQTEQDVAYTLSVASGQFNADAGYGYTMGSMVSAQATLDRLETRMGARAAYISTPSLYTQPALEYLYVRERTDRVGFFGNCLVLPPPSASPSLVVSTQTETPAATLLSMLPGARRVATIPMPGSEPFQVYRVTVPTTLPGETSLLNPIVYRSTAGPDLRLDGATTVPGALVLRLTALSATAPGALPEQYNVVGSQVNGTGAHSAPGAAFAATTCQPTSLAVGQTMLVWLNLPPAFATGATGQLPGPVAVTVQSSTTGFWEPTLGPLHLLSYVDVSTPTVDLTPVAAAPARAVTPPGIFSLPAATSPAP